MCIYIYIYAYVSIYIYINYVNLNKCKLCKGRRWTPVKPQQVGILLRDPNPSIPNKSLWKPSWPGCFECNLRLKKTTSIMWTHVWVHFLPPRITTYIVRSLTACLLHHLGLRQHHISSHCTHTHTHVPYKSTYQSVCFYFLENVDVCTNIEVYYGHSALCMHILMIWCMTACHIRNIDTSKYTLYIIYFYYICKCEHEHFGTAISFGCLY